MHTLRVALRTFFAIYCTVQHLLCVENTFRTGSYSTVRWRPLGQDYSVLLYVGDLSCTARMIIQRTALGTYYNEGEPTNYVRK